MMKRLATGCLLVTLFATSCSSSGSDDKGSADKGPDTHGSASTSDDAGLCGRLVDSELMPRIRDMEESAPTAAEATAVSDSLASNFSDALDHGDRVKELTEGIVVPTDIQSLRLSITSIQMSLTSGDTPSATDFQAVKDAVDAVTMDCSAAGVELP